MNFKSTAPKAIRILGLDPGLRHTGWGVVESDGRTLRPVAAGVVSAPTSGDLAVRLRQLFEGLSEVLDLYTPHEAAVEETFVNTNPTSTLRLGMARGVVMLAPASKGLPVFEYGANKVKKTVVGVGHADKDQVMMMVKRLLPTLGEVKVDAADALAIAICHSHHRETMNSWQEKRA
ncbi:MAG: crossover junction endodeoxyribonuclease RuvC [Holosporales bacterium]